jgi:hypothetical protein
MLIAGAGVRHEAVPQTQTGEGTGLNTIMRTVGGAIGGQAAASIVAAHVTSGGARRRMASRWRS